MIVLIYAISDTIFQIKCTQRQVKRIKTKSASSVELTFKIIVLGAFCVTLMGALVVLCENNTKFAKVFFGLYIVIWLYIALKQTVKLIFVPENNGFLLSDIKNFLFMYMFWWLLELMISTDHEVRESIYAYLINYEMVHLITVLLWCYFNILFALGGFYIFLYYLISGVKKIFLKWVPSYKIIVEKIHIIHSPPFCLDDYSDGCGLKIVELWTSNRYNKGFSRILLTFPYALKDILLLCLQFCMSSLKIALKMVLLPVADILRIICKHSPQIWNKHENNGWMYLFAQIAGLISYFIVLIAIQYGSYSEAARRIYEVTGTIIWIPYFVNRIGRISKD